MVCSLRSSRFLSFPGGDRTSERKSGRAKEQAWREQKNGEKWGGDEREGGKGARLTTSLWKRLLRKLAWCLYS